MAKLPMSPRVGCARATTSSTRSGASRGGPGTRTTVRYVIGLVPTAQRVLPGYRLRLLITSCDQDKGVAMLGFVHLLLSSPSRQSMGSSSRLLLPVIAGSATRNGG